MMLKCLLRRSGLAISRPSTSINQNKHLHGCWYNITPLCYTNYLSHGSLDYTRPRRDSQATLKAAWSSFGVPSTAGRQVAKRLLTQLLLSSHFIINQLHHRRDRISASLDLFKLAQSKRQPVLFGVLPSICQTQSYLRIGQRYLRMTQNPL